MVSLKLTSLVLVALRALSAVAQLPDGIEVESIEELEDAIDDPSKLQSTTLNVKISTTFPDSEVFGVKLVNGHPTRAVLDISNQEPEPIKLALQARR
nr:hypothetical protein B0A51_16469 [Rachicladosporium sp. CCFEE 5018]